MVQLKVFPLADYEGFNAFIKEHPPKGGDGIKYNQDSILLFYEDGDVMPFNRMQELQVSLAESKRKAVAYEVQINSSQEQIIKYKSNIAKIEELEPDAGSIGQHNKANMLKDLETKIKTTYNTVLIQESMLEIETATTKAIEKMITTA